MPLLKSFKKISFQLRKKIAQKLNVYNVKHSKIRNKQEYLDYYEKNLNIYNLCKKLNKKLQEKKLTEPPVFFKAKFKNFHVSFEKNFLNDTYKGFCIYCDKNVDFKYDFIIPNTPDVIFRERLFCPECQSTSRNRAMFFVIQKFAKNRKGLKIYCYEQVTLFHDLLQEWYGEENTVIGSEFIDDKLAPGTIVDKIRHEDALNLSFADESLDLVISNDVYEHVPDINKTLQEAFRVLRPGGYLMFTIPFFPEKDETVVRAKIENGELIYLMEKEIHGNPMLKEGSLAFYNFGWDIMEMQKEAGFKDPYIVAVLDEKFGHIDYTPVLIFVAKKEM